MLERTETGFEVFPECQNTIFTVSEPAEKRKTQKGKFYYLFRFTVPMNGRLRKYSEAMMVWMSGDILRALACREIEKGIFEWDRAEIVGRQIVADVMHEMDIKNPGKTFARLKNIRPLGGVIDKPAAVPAGVGASADEEIPF